jgi:hypothetical protein
MRPYVLYLRQCPGVVTPKDFKIGVAALDKVRTRLASYQNAVGPVYVEQFTHIWIGEDIDVKEAEKKIKLEFRKNIDSNEAGLSEWICNINKQDILDFISILGSEYFIKLYNVEAEFQPLTMGNCLDFQQWFEENNPII